MFRPFAVKSILTIIVTLYTCEYALQIVVDSCIRARPEDGPGEGPKHVVYIRTAMKAMKPTNTINK
jgi:hypothetical protein